MPYLKYLFIAMLNGVLEIYSENSGLRIFRKMANKRSQVTIFIRLVESSNGR